jgi:hypothetical protein
MRTKTYHQGANDERTAILAKIRRMRGFQRGKWLVRRSLINWLLQRNERYKKRKGGL